MRSQRPPQLVPVVSVPVLVPLLVPVVRSGEGVKPAGGRRSRMGRAVAGSSAHILNRSPISPVSISYAARSCWARSGPQDATSRCRRRANTQQHVNPAPAVIRAEAASLTLAPLGGGAKGPLWFFANSS